MNRLFDAGAAVRSYDVSPDGRRFLINLPASSADADDRHITARATTGTMKIATWNVNGIRARQGQLVDWLNAEKPDIVCLQEIKASLDQLSFELRDMEHYWSYWHGEKGYSGVALLVSKSLAGALPVCSHPGFDFEQRIACATVPSPAGDVMVASVYVPNGGKDFDAKMRFLHALDAYVADASRDGRLLLLCGDLNVARAERDIHPKLRNPNQIGARPEERAMIERIIANGIVDVGPHARSRQRQFVHVVGAVAQHEAAQHRLADRLRARLPGARLARERRRSCSGRLARATTVRWWSSSIFVARRALAGYCHFGNFSIAAFSAIGFLVHARVPDGDVDQVERHALAAGARVALRGVERRLRGLLFGVVGVARATAP